MNREFIEKLAALLESSPSSGYMSDWMTLTAAPQGQPETVIEVGEAGRFLNRAGIPHRDTPLCATTGCIAGWAVWLHHDIGVRSPVPSELLLEWSRWDLQDWIRTGADLLGITLAQARALFMPERLIDGGVFTWLRARGVEDMGDGRGMATVLRGLLSGEGMFYEDEDGATYMRVAEAPAEPQVPE